MSTALDRQIRPIYDALETGSNKSAVLACNKLLKKQPNNILVKALKALALVRQQKVEESLVLCDEVLVVKPTDDAVLTAMMHVLRSLGRQSDIIAMFENAYKQQPHNEDLATQTFYANIRTGNWKAAQQVAAKMHKQFQEDRFLFWSIFCAVLQANDASTSPALKPVLYQLAHRLIKASPNVSFHSADRLYVHLVILRELGMYDDALALLGTNVGQTICDTSLTCDAVRREIMKLKGLTKEEGDLARERILNKKDRNWLEFLSVLDATFWDVTSIPEPTDKDRERCKERINQAQDLFQQVADVDSLKDRSGMLALLELDKRARTFGFSSDAPRTFFLAEKYFMHFGDKACCVEDLSPYINFELNDRERWTAFLESHKSFDAAIDLQRGINVLKLIRYNLSESELTPELESTRATNYAQTYLDCLRFGKDLPDTELQPADDLAILAGHAFVTLWGLTESESHLYSAAALLEYASGRSKQSFRLRLLLIRIYHLLGAPSFALEHYRLMNVKQVQADTLSHLVLSRAATFSLAALGDITYLSECMESSQIYMSNSQETAEFIARAFQMERYTQIPEFIEFEDRLDNSLQRDLMKVEHVRMRLAHEVINADLVDMELIELKFIFDRLHHDNRDFEIFPNYQPRFSPSLNNQTLPFKKVPGLGWLTAFLKIYIKVFQQASDLDDTVEDKLLIGDRPKPSNDPENQTPLNNRLAKRKPEEFAELTLDEQSFYEYATALSEWLCSYHDYVRPSPSTLLAEAAKANELRSGNPAKPPTSPTNGSAAKGNVHTKKDEESLAVKEPPELISKFFDGKDLFYTPEHFGNPLNARLPAQCFIDIWASLAHVYQAFVEVPWSSDMRARFQGIVSGSRHPPELLHIATITQEAFIVFSIETTRFKPTSVVKINKLGGLVNMFKDIRTKAATVLNEMSVQLSQLAEQAATQESRKTFTDASQNIQSTAGFDHDFVLGVAKKVTDARKEIYEGIGKGISKVVKNHS